MDVLQILVLISAVAGVMSQNNTESTTQDIITTETEAPTTTPLPPRNCSTAHGLAGACSQRLSCEHSTTAIDFTLYAPSWYKSSCRSDEVCCPFDALVTQDSDPPKGDPSLIPSSPDAGNDDDDFDDDNFE